MPETITYSVKTAAAACSVSESTILAAINAGDLAYTRPTVAGKPIRNRLIDPDELSRWAKNRVA